MGSFGARRDRICSTMAGPIFDRSHAMPQPYYVGLDISVKETTISVVDELGHVAHRAVVATDPAALVEHLVRLGFTYSRIGLGSRTAFSVDLRRVGGCRASRDLSRAPPDACCALRSDQQDGSQRCTRHCSDDAGWPLQGCSCQDASQSATASAPHRAQTSPA